MASTDEKEAKQSPKIGQSLSHVFLGSNFELAPNFVPSCEAIPRFVKQHTSLIIHGEKHCVTRIRMAARKTSKFGCCEQICNDEIR